MSDTLQFDAATLRRYDRPGPRYTSYPTAPQFGGEFDEAVLRESIRRSNADPIPRRLSLYLHIPYCFSPCFYCGCTRIITRDATKGRTYVARLVREIEHLGALFDRDREVIQLHFGGGTPNFLRPAELEEVVESVRSHFRLSACADRDFSLELDPRFIQDGDVAAYARLGFNRASLGVQDFDPEVQRAVNRIQGVEQTLRVIDDCRKTGFRSINVDLIYGSAETDDGGIRSHARYGPASPPRSACDLRLCASARSLQAAAADRGGRLAFARSEARTAALAVEKLSAAGYRTSAWTISRCPKTIWRAPRRPGLCSATSWAIRHTRSAIWSAWA